MQMFPYAPSDEMFFLHFNGAITLAWDYVDFQLLEELKVFIVNIVKLRVNLWGYLNCFRENGALA